MTGYEIAVWFTIVNTVILIGVGVYVWRLWKK